MKPGDIVTEHGKFDMDQAAAGMRQAQEMMKNPEFAKMMREGLRQANQAGALGAE
jgi:pantoate kinase